MSEEKSFPISKAFTKELVDLCAECLKNNTTASTVELSFPKFDVLVNIEFTVKPKTEGEG